MENKKCIDNTNECLFIYCDDCKKHLGGRGYFIIAIFGIHVMNNISCMSYLSQTKVTYLNWVGLETVCSFNKLLDAADTVSRCLIILHIFVDKTFQIQW